MKSYSTFQPGVLVTTTRSGSTVNAVLSTRTQRVVSLSTLPNPGNYKSPTAQQFDRTQESRMKGVFISGFSGSSNETVFEGSLGYGSVPFGGMQASFDPLVVLQAQSRFYDRVRGELDLAIDLLERRQTQSMVSNCLRGLRDLGSTVQQMRRALANPVRGSRDSANLWLQYTYGWKPLASSIYGTLKRFQEGPPQGFVKVVVSASDNKSRTVSWNTTGDLVPTVSYENSSYRCRMVGSFSIQPSVLNNLASVSSLNPLSIAWELVPYSFVVDWVYDVGGYLRNLESALLYASAYKGGYMTEGYLVTGNSFVLGGYESSGLKRYYNLSGSYRYSGKRRTVLGSIPYPRRPRFHVDLGSSRVLSAVALLRQRLR